MKKLINRLTEYPDPEIQVLTDLGYDPTCMSNPGL